MRITNKFPDDQLVAAMQTKEDVLWFTDIVKYKVAEVLPPDNNNYRW